MINRKYLTDSVSWSMWPGRILRNMIADCDIHYEKPEDKHYHFWMAAMVKRPTICITCLRAIEADIWRTIRRGAEAVSMILYKNQND